MNYAALYASIISVYCQPLTPKRYILGYENGQPQFLETNQRFRCVSLLSGRIRILYRSSKNLSALLEALLYEDLGSEIFPVPPEDLPAYLKVWPMKQLPGRIHGWQSADLGVIIDWNNMRQLLAYIGIHEPENLSARIKGWVREATSDLGGWIRAFQYEGLGGIIRATYIKDLPAYIFSIAPKDLGGLIHGWEERDLPASLIGIYGLYDIRAYINAVGAPVDLPAYLKAMKGTQVPSNLPAYLNPASILMQQANLAAQIATHEPGNLPATLIVSGGSSDLPAFIRPKIVFMSTALSVATMEHSNLGAIVNFICRSSGYKNLGATIDFSYLSNLAAQITGKKIPVNQADLAASVGYAANYVFADHVPVPLTVGTGYSIEDKIPILLSIYKQRAYLSAAITGTYMYSDMAATVTPTWLAEYEFDNVKSREIVYDLNHARQVNWYEIVEMYFKSIVSDYFYVGAEKRVYKTDRTDRWILELASFVPQDMVLNIRRKLHRVKDIYDLTRFNNLDEAIRFAIHYVTSYDYGDLRSTIMASGGFTNLRCSIAPRRFIESSDGLAASIAPQQKSFVLGYDNKVEFI